jgi:hypothetical protein
MPALLFAVALATVSPMPAPNDVKAQEQASQCIYYYRLQLPFSPGGSAACEAKGYGLEFMREHAAEVAELERKRQAKLDADLAHGREVAAVRARATELQGPCEAMILDGGPGPDGGQALCDMAGFPRVLVVRRAERAARLQRAQEAERRRNGVRWGAAVVAALLVGAGAWRWRRRQPGA